MVSQKTGGKKRTSVRHVVVSEDFIDQRIDNYLLNQYKGVPKSRIYRLLRKGEVRVNSKRVKPSYRLVEGDNVRLPPLVVTEKAKTVPPSKSTITRLADRILYEDEGVIVINKPSGMSVHAGSTVRMGLIEAMRHLYPNLPHLELAHRLDAETSGCLVLAKKKRVLREIHGLLRAGKVTKIYQALTKGRWKKNELNVNVPLHKHYRDGGKHVVKVQHDGKEAETVFRTLETYANCSLMQVKLKTGRTHQIRVHAAHQGHPLAADDRYGESDFNKEIKAVGLKRMFLHAYSIDFTLPSTNQHIKVKAPLDPDLQAVVNNLKCNAE